jgi:hypothetical protein
MDAGLERPDIRRLFVLSHPNHELAVFGLAQRWRPHLLYLTDGGGEERVAQTRRGLESIGLLENARFLNFSEPSFYRGLLDRDVAFFRRVADAVRAEIDSSRPEQVFCDAVEFYNPVHDMSLPVVRAALGGAAHPPVYAIPLIYQKAAAAETYEVHRWPPSLQTRQQEVRLTPAELAAKIRARADVYSLLREQMGPITMDLPDEHLLVEVVAPAEACLAPPGPERVLRYEWRARRLQERGKVERIITYAEHYVPVVSTLLGA